MKKELILVKLGGSVITDINVPNKARMGNVKRLVAEIGRAAAAGRGVIVGHGAGSFAHVPAHKYRVNEGFINNKSRIGASITQLSAAELHRIIVAEFVKAGIEVFSFSPSSSAIARSGRIVQWDTKPMEAALEKGFVPLVYGDVAIDAKQGVCIASTEEVFRYLSSKFKPAKVVIGTDVDGVFDKDPKTLKSATLIPRINWLGDRTVTFSSNRKFDVTGSMKRKVELMYEIAKTSKTRCYIVNANVPDRLYRAMTGKSIRSTIVEID
jgi:isopentenyl phosphate kinase